MTRLDETIDKPIIHDVDGSAVSLLTDNLLCKYRTFKALRSECRDVKGMVEESRECQLQIRIIEPAGCGIADQTTLLQPARTRLERDGVVPSPEIQSCHIERRQRADTVFSQRVLASALAGL